MQEKIGERFISTTSDGAKGKGLACDRASGWRTGGDLRVECARCANPPVRLSIPIGDLPPAEPVPGGRWFTGQAWATSLLAVLHTDFTFLLIGHSLLILRSVFNTGVQMIRRFPLLVKAVSDCGIYWC